MQSLVYLCNCYRSKMSLIQCQYWLLLSWLSLLLLIQVPLINRYVTIVTVACVNMILIMLVPWCCITSITLQFTCKAMYASGCVGIMCNGRSPSMRVLVKLPCNYGEHRLEVKESNICLYTKYNNVFIIINVCQSFWWWIMIIEPSTPHYTLFAFTWALVTATRKAFVVTSIYELPCS